MRTERCHVLRILDICNEVATIKHVHSTGVSKTVYGVNSLEAFFGKGLFEIFFADSINAMACQFFTVLIDKETALIRGIWGHPVFGDIELEKLNGFELKIDDKIAI